MVDQIRNQNINNKPKRQTSHASIYVDFSTLCPEAAILKHHIVYYYYYYLDLIDDVAIITKRLVDCKDLQQMISFLFRGCQLNEKYTDRSNP